MELKSNIPVGPIQTGWAESLVAVYEGGFLRPLKPLNLPERQTVYLQIVASPAENQLDQMLQFLAKTGAITLPSTQTAIQQPSLSERQELAARIGRAVTKPLSQIIIEDRGAW